MRAPYSSMYAPRQSHALHLEQTSEEGLDKAEEAEKADFGAEGNTVGGD